MRKASVATLGVMSEGCAEPIKARLSDILPKILEVSLVWCLLTARGVLLDISIFPVVGSGGELKEVGGKMYPVVSGCVTEQDMDGSGPTSVVLDSVSRIFRIGYWFSLSRCYWCV